MSERNAGGGAQAPLEQQMKERDAGMLLKLPVSADPEKGDAGRGAQALLKQQKRRRLKGEVLRLPLEPAEVRKKAEKAISEKKLA
jgi:hypothetical protein